MFMTINILGSSNATLLNMNKYLKHLVPFEAANGADNSSKMLFRSEFLW